MTHSGKRLIRHTSPVPVAVAVSSSQHGRGEQQHRALLQRGAATRSATGQSEYLAITLLKLKSNFKTNYCSLLDLRPGSYHSASISVYNWTSYNNLYSLFQPVLFYKK